jgi:hypothetical protein
MGKINSKADLSATVLDVKRRIENKKMNSY